jgi:hypothetical protein
MAKKLSETEATQILGIAGDNTQNGNIRADEFLPELRGKRGVIMIALLVLLCTLLSRYYVT